MDPRERFEELAYESSMTPDDLKGLIELLPPSDEELDTWADHFIGGRHEAGTWHLMLAAFIAGRKLDARHLPLAATAVPRHEALATVVGRFHGDVMAAVIEMCRQRRMATSLLAAAIWSAAHWRNRQAVRPPVEELVDAATSLMAEVRDSNMMAFMVATRECLGSDATWSDPQRFKEVAGHKEIQETAKALHENAALILESPMEQALTKDGHQEQNGPRRTIRRSAPKIGPNEPCPCGSGKKYKRCCKSQGDLRVSDGPSTPERTRLEVARNPFVDLTPERIKAMRLPNLVHADPQTIEPRFHDAILTKLVEYNEFEALLSFFQKATITADYAPHIEKTLYNCCTRERFDLLPMFVSLIPESLRPSVKMPLAAMEWESIPELMQIAEEEARKGLESWEAAKLAYDLINGPTPALGLLVARGVLACMPVAIKKERLLRAMDKARLKLGLQAGDPIRHLVRLQNRSKEEMERAAGQQLEAARRRANQAAEEVYRTRQTLLRTEKDLDEARTQLESQATTTTSGAHETAATLAARVEELRRLRDSMRHEVAELKSQRHEVEQHLEKLEADDMETPSPAQPGAAAEAKSPDEEADDEGWSESVSESHHPVLLPAFAAGFERSFRELPNRIRSTALARIGRMAAGEQSAFVGQDQLEEEKRFRRVKLGRNHRLIFTATSEKILFVDIVNRRDLDHSIKRLRWLKEI